MKPSDLTALKALYMVIVSSFLCQFYSLLRATDIESVDLKWPRADTALGCLCTSQFIAPTKLLMASAAPHSLVYCSSASLIPLPPKHEVVMTSLSPVPHLRAIKTHTVLLILYGDAVRCLPPSSWLVVCESLVARPGSAQMSVFHAVAKGVF